MSYQKLSEILAKTIEPLSPKILKQVSTCEIINPSKFPYATVIEDDTADDEIIFDTISNLANYKFKIRLVDSMNGTKTMESVSKNMRKIVDEVLTKIRENQYWECQAQRVNLSVRWGWSTEEKLRIAEIGVEFLILVEI